MLLASAAEVMGEGVVVDWCRRLIVEIDYEADPEQGPNDDPDLAWLGGNEEWAPYWRRVWGARGLLYVWDSDASTPLTAALSRALTDEHWRVREMGCKVVRHRRIDALLTPVAGLQDDDNARVRAAAARALVTLTEHHPPDPAAGWGSSDA